MVLISVKERMLEFCYDLLFNLSSYSSIGGDTNVEGTQAIIRGTQFLACTASSLEPSVN